MRSKRLAFGDHKNWQVLACAPFLMLVALVGCGINQKTYDYTKLVITPQQTSVHVGQTKTFEALIGPDQMTDGTWSVVGGQLNGTISNSGVYQSPTGIPENGTVTIDYADGGTLHQATISLENPIPNIAQITPASVTAPTFSLAAIGSGFVNGSVILVNGVATQTTFLDSSHLSANITLATPTAASITIQVANPNPGGQLSDALGLPVSIGSMTVSPSTLAHGKLTVTATSGLSTSSIATVIVTPPPPEISRLKLKPTTFRRGRNLARASRVALTGTTISFALSERASVALNFARVTNS